MLRKGETLEFGRGVGGVGRITGHRAVSARHGTIAVTSAGVAVTSTGSRTGFAVVDRTTPSRLHIARGVGPISIPFADFSIVVAHQEGRDFLNVKVAGSATADAWATGWGPQVRDEWDRATSASGTADPWPRLNWRRADGTPYAWFTTLVALCEPAMTNVVAGTPTNGQLASRLRVSHQTVEKHLRSIYDTFGAAGAGDRDVIVAVAVDQGIVTPADVARLP